MIKVVNNQKRGNTMAMTWIPNEKFMTHNGVEIFHVYKSDDHDNGMMKYSFCLYDHCTECGEGVFDVRELETKGVYSTDSQIKDAIAAAIDNGELEQYEQE